MDVRALGVSQLQDRPCYSSRVLSRQCYSSQTDKCNSSVLQHNFIQKIAGKYTLEERGHADPKTQREERERGAPSLWLLFLYVPFPTPGLLFVNWASQECCFLCEVLTPVLGPSFVLFSRAFPFLVFQPPPFWTPLSYSKRLARLWDGFLESLRFPAALLETGKLVITLQLAETQLPPCTCMPAIRKVNIAQHLILL